MRLTYTPEDGDQQEFAFRPGDLFSFEAEAIEEAGGTAWTTFEEYGNRFIDGQFKARRAALWIMLRRENPKLRFVDVVCKVKELDVAYDADELKRMRERIEGDTSMSDEDRAAALAEIEAAEQTVEPEPLGKDGSDDTTTGSELPQPDTEPSPSN